MKLARRNIKNIRPQDGLSIPDEKLFSLPEKVLQFGTGVLLRGLPDHFIDKANRQGIFNGRIVVVKSTASGSTEDFDRQDGLYTVCIRGFENGKKVDEAIINSSISRVISANENWPSVLECAANPEMKIIVSNTTEVGITLVQDDIRLYPPLSFPGKLLSFLHERFKIFKGSRESGMVIIPTELIIDNGTKLRSILLELAMMNRLEHDFIDWLRNSNHFCNSLVDRIVPGAMGEPDLSATLGKLGYKDDLMIMAESFRLWAIETNEPIVREILSFANADEGVVISPSIEKFRELKLRLLNGTHSLSCGLAYLAGFDTVKEGMNDVNLSSFIQNLLMQEICPAVVNNAISGEEAIDFATKTLDRFRNPFLEHQWLSITMQYSTKMKMRVIPLLEKYYSKQATAPELISLGFAAFLLFMKGRRNSDNTWEGFSNSRNYAIKDEKAEWFASKWEECGSEKIVEAILSESSLWGEDLTRFPGFAEAVKHHLSSLLDHGVMASVRRIQLKKSKVA